jgi:hypothetical protein
LEKLVLLEVEEGADVGAEGAAEVGAVEDLEEVEPGSTHERGEIPGRCYASGRDT